MSALFRSHNGRQFQCFGSPLWNTHSQLAHHRPCSREPFCKSFFGLPKRTKNWQKNKIQRCFPLKIQISDFEIKHKIRKRILLHKSLYARWISHKNSKLGFYGNQKFGFQNRKYNKSGFLKWNPPRRKISVKQNPFSDFMFYLEIRNPGIKIQIQIPDTISKVSANVMIGSVHFKFRVRGRVKISSSSKLIELLRLVSDNAKQTCAFVCNLIYGGNLPVESSFSIVSK